MRRGWIAFGAALTFLSGPGARAQDAVGGGLCGPRLLRSEEPAQLHWRIQAVQSLEHRYGFRTPFTEASSCGTPTKATEVIAAGGVERGAVRYGALLKPPMVEDRAAPATSVRGWAAPSEHIALALQGTTLGSEARLQEASILLVGGPIYGWLGRRPVGYGVGAQGSTVLSGRVPLDGVGFGVREPFRLPFLLKYLGEWDLEGFWARASDNGPIGNPNLGAARGTWTPWPGITFGTTRGAMFNGEGAPGLTWRRLWSTIIGSHLREDGERLQFNNQIMTLDAVIRASVAGVPFALYAELGAEDSAGGWTESPSLVGGLEVASPDGGWLIGLGQAYMHPINGHGYFYRHSLYTAGWSDEGHGLGHPLAGPGREWHVNATAIDIDGDRWDVDGAVFVRDRYEGTSMGPIWIGRAVGGRLRGRLDVGAIDLYVDMEGEHHEDGHGLLVGRVGIRWTTGPIR